ncbi:MAG: NADPH:quinone reductase [Pyrinomonadaceae bacterium]
MKAIVVGEYGGPEELVLSDIPVPEFGPDEVLVRIHAAGVNPVDTYVREGNHPSAPPVPFTPGKDGAGMVEKIGEGVRGVSAGDRVYLAGSVTGTYAEFAVAKESQVRPLPGNVGFEAGAGIFVPYATAYLAVFKKGQPKPGDKLLVHGGSGAVGLAAIQWSKAAGLEVCATAGSPNGLDLIRNNGVNLVYDHSSVGYLDRIKADTGGVDIILEMLANVNLVEDFRVINKFGRIVVIGNRGTIEFNPRLAMTLDVDIRGLMLFNAGAEEFERIHSEIYSGLESGALKPHVGTRYSLVNAAEAHRAIIKEKASGKIVLIP